MPLYRIECTGEVRELYEIEAASPDEARANWTDATLVLSEASTEPVNVEEIED
jgi:hypothetical protein